MFVSHIIVSWLVLNMKRKVTITNTAEEMEKLAASFGVKKKKKKKSAEGQRAKEERATNRGPRKEYK